jgi:ABC-2 type transport system permease protein
MIRAILRAQWLSMRFGWGRRGLAIVAGLLWYGLWAFVALAVGLALADASPAELRLYLPTGLLGVCAYWQLMPVLSASMGSALELRKLIVYPIPHAKLFAIEVLLRLTTGVEMLLVVVAGAFGVAANPEAGGSATVARLALALPLLIAFNLLLSSGTRSLLERLLSRRKVREIVALLLAMLWVVPRLLVYLGYGKGSLHRVGAAMQTVALPWTAAADAILGDTALLVFASLAAWTVAAGVYGRWQFERGLRHDSAAAQAGPARANPTRLAAAERLYRWPALLFPDPLAGMIEKELRTLARTPRFRTVFIMGFTFGLAVWLPVAVNRKGPAESWFLTVVSVYALTLLGQVSYWNCFGFDRSAVAFYFAAPIPFPRVIVAKNIAALAFIYLEVILVIVVTTLFHLSAGWSQAVETLAVTTVCAAYLLALGNWGSVRYPRGLSGERASQGGGRGFQGFLFLIYPAALLPVGLAYLAKYAFDSGVIFALVLAASGIIGGAFYWMSLDAAVSVAGARRERLIAELSTSDGPIATG